MEFDLWFQLYATFLSVCVCTVYTRKMFLHIVLYWIMLGKVKRDAKKEIKRWRMMAEEEKKSKAPDNTQNVCWSDKCFYFLNEQLFNAFGWDKLSICAMVEARAEVIKTWPKDRANEIRRKGSIGTQKNTEFCLLSFSLSLGDYSSLAEDDLKRWKFIGKCRKQQLCQLSN